MAGPPIRDEKALFVEEPLGEGLDSFDSEASFERLDRRAGTERTSELDLFPSEHVAADDLAAGAVPEPVVAARALVAVERHAVVVATAPGAVVVPPERLPGVPATQRAPVSLTRRLALVAGILACLGVPTVGILLWRSPARGAAPAAVVRDGPVPSVASVSPQEPISTLLPMPTSGAATTPEPATTSEPITLPETAADGRGPIATSAAVADTPPPRTEPATRIEGPEQDVSADTADTIETAAAPLAAENMATPMSAAPAELGVSSPLAEQPLSVTLTPSVDTPAAPLPPAPPMSPPAGPVSAPAVAGAGSATAVTLAPAPARDAADIQTVLTRYRSAFSDLDAAAVSQVWPNADGRALARAFSGLEEQGIAFESCDIWVGGTSAAATCGGTVRYVTKVGSRDPRTEHRRWQFTLGKVRDLWMIQTVESR